MGEGNFLLTQTGNIEKLVVFMVSIIGQNFTAGGGQGAALAGLPQRAADPTPTEIATTSATQVATGKAVVTPDLDNAQMIDQLQKRAEAFKQGIAKALPEFFYPVSHVKFTIFKEGGQYITKFTNIISGQTTQIPEPELLQKISLT